MSNVDATQNGAPRKLAWWRSEPAHRLLTFVLVGLVAAVVTGPEGTQSDYAYGLKQSVLKPRVFIYLALALGLWAAYEFGGRQGWGGHVSDQLKPLRAGLRQRANRRNVRIGYALLAIAAIVLPMGLSSFWQAVLVTEIGLYVLLALGLNVVVGFAGLLDLGYIAFYAIGAYLTAYFTGRLPITPPFQLNPFLILPLAVIAALAAGIILGAPTLRLRGDYLAIVTLGFGEIVYQFALIKTDVTGGSSGAFNIPHFSVNLAGVKYMWGLDPLPYYYLVLGFIILVVILFSRLEHSRVGRAWAAIREDEVAASAMGVWTLKYKLMAFAIGASTSGVAGVIYASNVSTVTPDGFLLQNSIIVLVLVIFGGMGSIWGVLLGAALLQYVPEALRDYVPPSDRFIYFGALLIVMMIFRPEGLLPSRRRKFEFALARTGLVEGDALTEPLGGPVAARSSE
ncbi:MAG TPA: branched-chain amino acid ABC transporter permease [Mycobacteriales bacterium]|nr:branched-chain amino acid ABC transporter permease [Mycobacteriales bacterium]